MSFDKPQEYWVRMGEIGELIASDTFSRIMQERYGRVQLIVNGHDELHKSDLYPIDNFDEDAHHLDLVAADMRANLKYWVYGIAEVKSTLSKSKTEFALNGMCPHYLWAAVRAGIPIYLLVVRFPSCCCYSIQTDAVSQFAQAKSLCQTPPAPCWCRLSGCSLSCCRHRSCSAICS